MSAAPSDAARTLAQDIAGALAWWREAGVDQGFADEPTQWIAEDPAPEPAVQHDEAAALPPPPPIAQIGGDRAGWPDTLADFGQWWLREPSLDLGGSGARIAPRGPPGAAVMVLVAEPEAGDGATLLAGPQGKLLDSMLAVCGIARDDAYVASLLPRHTPMCDWDAVAQAGLGTIALHHLALAAPQRVWVFGQTVLPLIGHDPAKSPADLQFLNHEGGSVAVLAAGDLATLLARPRARAAWWARWLEWTGN